MRFLVRVLNSDLCTRSSIPPYRVCPLVGLLGRFRVNDKVEFLNAVKDLKKAIDFFKQKPKYYNATKLMQKMVWHGPSAVSSACDLLYTSCGPDCCIDCSGS